MVVRSTLAGDEQTIIFLEKSVQLTTVKTRKINIKKIWLKRILYATTENSKGGKHWARHSNTIRLEKEAEREKLILRKGRIRPRKSIVDRLVQSTFLRQIFRLFAQCRTGVDHTCDGRNRLIPCRLTMFDCLQHDGRHRPVLGSDVNNEGGPPSWPAKLFRWLTAWSWLNDRPATKPTAGWPPETAACINWCGPRCSPP